MWSATMIAPSFSMERKRSEKSERDASKVEENEVRLAWQALERLYGVAHLGINVDAQACLADHGGDRLVQMDFHRGDAPSRSAGGVDEPDCRITEGCDELQDGRLFETTNQNVEKLAGPRASIGSAAPSSVSGAPLRMQ